MTTAGKAATRNRLLRILPDADFAQLAPALLRVDLPKGETLVHPGDPITHGWFLDEGVGSVIAHAPDGDTAEIGMYGYEGFACIPAILGTTRSEHSLVVQVAGAGWRIEAATLQAAMRELPALARLMLAYVHCFLAQVGQTAVSNANHSIEERLSRWLLMTHDRVDDDRIPLTHEYLATMLAVRRPSVTTALHVLEGLGYVRGQRGVILMRDRAGLEAFAAAAYGVPEAAYEKMIGLLR